MTPEQAKELLPIIQAFADGAAIECRGKYDEWGFVSDPTWRHTLEYRVKPKPDGSERVRKMLESGKPVLCRVHDKSQDAADKSTLLIPIRGAFYKTASNYPFKPDEDMGGEWRYASPVDLSQFAVEDTA